MCWNIVSFLPMYICISGITCRYNSIHQSSTLFFGVCGNIFHHTLLPILTPLLPPLCRRCCDCPGQGSSDEPSTAALYESETLPTHGLEW